MRTLFLALGLILVFAAASAPGSTSRPKVRNGPLTVFGDASSPTAPSKSATAIVTVGRGKPTTFWHCPHYVWCGEWVSFAWAPDGRRIAVTLDEIGGNSPYPFGIHIVNVVSGLDRQVPSDGCFAAAELAWSPSGSSLAYECGAQIKVLTLRTSGYTTVPTGTNAYWPSWSPSATRIAYSTQLHPKEDSRIYTVALDGSQPRLVASGGAAPAWSPDGRTIAYQTRCGIRLVTPSGRNVTPRSTAKGCGAMGPSGGPPVWSPDGTKLAVEDKIGIYVMNKDGLALHRVSLTPHGIGAPIPPTTWYGRLPARPSWQPTH